jgi:hypothetical protein
MDGTLTRNRDPYFDLGTFDKWTDDLYSPNDASLLPPDLGNEIVIRHPGLPALPNAVFCSYLCDSWASNAINKLVREVTFAKRSNRKKVMTRLTPLLRAAILESVRYFWM